MSINEPLSQESVPEHSNRSTPAANAGVRRSGEDLARVADYVGFLHDVAVHVLGEAGLAVLYQPFRPFSYAELSSSEWSPPCPLRSNGS